MAHEYDNNLLRWRKELIRERLVIYQQDLVNWINSMLNLLVISIDIGYVLVSVSLA